MRWGRHDQGKTQSANDPDCLWKLFSVLSGLAEFLLFCTSAQMAGWKTDQETVGGDR